MWATQSVRAHYDSTFLEFSVNGTLTSFVCAGYSNWYLSPRIILGELVPDQLAIGNHSLRASQSKNQFQGHSHLNTHLQLTALDIQMH